TDVPRVRNDETALVVQLAEFFSLLGNRSHSGTLSRAATFSATRF
ncbi:MAG: hypothetical protein JWO45_105, partial [Spartobacteria bacterium]|nr:hypothetical protein [Spartobacteria bacterium]